MAYRKLKFDGADYYFNFSVFKDLFSKKHIKEKTSIGELEENMANNINVSREAVHNWRFEQNGPADIETIYQIANYFNLSDVKLLLTKKKGVDNNMLNELQIQSAKKVYDSIIEFLDIFEKTNGFNDLWFNIKKEPEFREDKLWNIATKEHNKVILSFNKEYFYLKNTQIYKDLENFIYNDLYEIYDGKLKYAYRFEAQVDGNSTTDEDYNKALNLINEIIEKYI